MNEKSLSPPFYFTSIDITTNTSDIIVEIQMNFNSWSASSYVKVTSVSEDANIAETKEETKEKAIISIIVSTGLIFDSKGKKIEKSNKAAVDAFINFEIIFCVVVVILNPFINCRNWSSME